MASDRYVIHGGVSGRERLRVLSEVMGPATRRLLEAVGLPTGGHCLDLGCGGGDVSCELARLVGPTGRVVGVDLDSTKLALAQQEADAQGCTHVAFETGDVVGWTPAELVDAVYMRFLLTHLPDPDGLVADVHRYLKLGGVLIVEDIDFRGHFAEPSCPALDAYVELYARLVQRRGADPHIGPKLPGLLRDAGFNDVRMTMHQPVALRGGIKSLTCITLAGIAEAALRDKQVTETELGQLTASLRAFADDPHTVLGGPRVFQVVGRRP